MNCTEKQRPLLYKPKRFMLAASVAGLLSFIILIALDSFYPLNTHLGIIPLIRFRNYMETIPVMLYTSLFGHTAGAVLVLAFFSFQTMKSQFLIFHAFLLLIASLVANIPLVRKWYASIPKTLLTIVLFSIILGNACNFVDTIVQGEYIHIHYSLLQEMFRFVTALPPSIIVCVLNYLFYNYSGQRERNFFSSTYFIAENTDYIKTILSRRNKNSITKTMMFPILFEAVIIIISALGSAGALFSSQFETLPDLVKIVFITRLFILLLIVTIPVVIVLVEHLRNNITNPIVLMTNAVENGSVFLDHEQADSCPTDIQTLQIENDNEIGILYDSLLRASKNSRKYIEKLEQEKELKSNLEIANAANKAKSSFLSNMSHEIRTPINAVLGFDEMILRAATTPEIREYAENIQSAGKNLLSLINDILDFSKIEAGKMEIIEADYELSSVINDLINMISFRAKEKNLALNVEVDEGLPHLLRGDEIRLKQCILNILTNAVKYTNVGSVTMRIGGTVENGCLNLEVHVADTGIGIKTEDKKKLFTAFQRIEEERNRTIEGTGLGMNIVQQLLHLMGSTLNVDSEYGKGSDFWFVVRQSIVDAAPIGQFSQKYKVALQSCACYRESFHAPDAEILVVDDTKLNLTVFCDLLKDTQMKIDTATSGEETLELVAQKKYDILFIDHRMPGMDGIETLHAMQRLEANLNKETPCIALTANAISGAKEMYLSEGFSDYFTKPIDSAKLEKLLVTYLPPEKVELYCAEEAPPSAQNDGAAEFAGVDGIDAHAALANCGTAGTLRTALTEFAGAIDEKSAAIEQFAAAKDFRNYTVLVHALKSTSRLIGATELSEKAAYLEHCGDTQDDEQIQSLTPALLLLYRSYKQNLAPFNESGANGTANSPKEAMSDENFAEALCSLRECADAFDFDTADQIVALIAQYSLSESAAQKFSTVKKLVKSADHDALMKIL